MVENLDLARRFWVWKGGCLFGMHSKRRITNSSVPTLIPKLFNCTADSVSFNIHIIQPRLVSDLAADIVYREVLALNVDLDHFEDLTKDLSSSLFSLREMLLLYELIFSLLPWHRFTIPLANCSFLNPQNCPIYPSPKLESQRAFPFASCSAHSHILLSMLMLYLQYL